MTDAFRQAGALTGFQETDDGSPCLIESLTPLVIVRYQRIFLLLSPSFSFLTDPISQETLRVWNLPGTFSPGTF